MTIRPIVAGLTSFLCTVLLARWIAIDAIPMFLVGASTAIVVGVAVIAAYRAIALSIASGVVLAIIILATRLPLPTEHDISKHADHAVSITGWIALPPELSPTRTRYIVTVESVTTKGVTEHVEGKIRINDDATWPAFAMGDAVIVRGMLERPGTIDGFDEAAYLRIRGISAVMRRAALSAWTAAPTTPWTIRLSPLRPLSALRAWYERQITRILPEPHASLVAGLLTGSRVGLPRPLSDALRKAGLSHIVAISGYNVTMILSLASSMLFWLPKRRRVVPLMVGTTAFVLFVGAEAPVVRAGIMGMLGLIALEAERPLSPRLLILWAASLMAAWNPLLLQYDVSFQLSFLATIGLTEIGPLILRGLTRVPAALAIRESLAATLAAQIATLPLSILVFRQFSLIAPLSNLLVAPLIPLAMLTGGVGALVSVVIAPLGLAWGYVAWGIVSLILWIAQISASLPLASITW